MRATRDWPLAASLLLVGAALFFGGGVGDGSLPWLGGAALGGQVVLAGTEGIPGGLASLAPLAALAVWFAVTIGWSSLPARSWDYADRALVYLLAAALGLWLAGRTRGLALGLMALVGAVVAWSLLGKVLPPVYDYAGPEVTRLRGPIGLWNQLALAADFGLPLALWRRGRSGTLLAYLCLVALVLTYSRGGLATALVVCVLWFALGRERIAAGMTLLAAAVPAAVVVGIAFALPGITSDSQSNATRWHDGLAFGAALLVGLLASLALARLRQPRDTPLLRRVLVVLGVLAAVALVALVVVKAGSFTSTTEVSNAGPAHFASGGSNFRTAWWKQALDGWRHAKLGGTGAGSFHLTNIRYRTTVLDETTEPHDLPLQMLSETGLVGLAIFLAAVALLLRGSFRRREGHELALALILPAFLLHSLVDVDWDFAAVTIPALVVAGSLVGKAPQRRVSPFAVLAATGAALFAFGALLLPWLGNRWASDALVASPKQAVKLANRAHSVDPLLIEPYWAKAYAAIPGSPRRAFGEFVAAVHRQPKDPQTWLAAGQYALSLDCYRSAYTYLERYTELDPNGERQNGDDYRRALKEVNLGHNNC